MDKIWVLVVIVFVIISAVQKFLESREQNKDEDEDAEETRGHMHEARREVPYGPLEHPVRRIPQRRGVAPAREGEVRERPAFEEAFGPEQEDADGWTTVPPLVERRPVPTPQRRPQAPARKQAPPRRTQPAQPAQPAARRSQPPQEPQPRPALQRPAVPPAPKRAQPLPVARKDRPYRQARSPWGTPPRVRPREGGRPYLFADIDDFRRGIILSEVLGPPKALE